MIPLSLYIHLPWCLKKCPYCDFNAHPLKGHIDFEAYIQRLIEDLHNHKEILSTRKLHSIFIGGGTPSLFTGQQLSPLLSAIRQYQNIDHIEVTIEANPGTQDYANYQDYRHIGINRISIGGQSFNPTMLENIGRFHSANMVHHAILQAQQSGFSRINLDIMYGLPHQTTQEAIDDLTQFLTYNIEHLSWYQLNIEKNTLFAVHKPDLPSQEVIDAIDQQGHTLLKQHHYQNYEISAWTKDQPSHHNLNYWHFGDYLGIGCGAHSKITSQPFSINRIIKHKHPAAYMKNLIQSQTTVPSNERVLEYCINAFRTPTPLSFQEFEERTNLSRNSLIQALQAAIDLQLITIDSYTVQLTDKGFRHHNDLCLSLLD